MQNILGGVPGLLTLKVEVYINVYRKKTIYRPFLYEARRAFETALAIDADYQPALDGLKRLK